MTVLLLLLMAFQVTGDRLHEWFGAGMLLLFILHNILNIKWYGNIFKGKYTPLRIFQTAVNIAVLGAMLCLGFGGVVMSRHVFAALPVNGPMATARSMHLSASYWGFVLMASISDFIGEWQWECSKNIKGKKTSRSGCVDGSSNCGCYCCVRTCLLCTKRYFFLYDTEKPICFF